jgi:hypothetical protein
MLNRMKISLILLPLVATVLIGAYVYSLWTGERRRSAEVPVEAASMMMRDLLAFHGKRGSFPSDLKRLEGVVWEKKPDRDFSIENRALSHRNYLYLYTRLNEHGFTLWAVPTGSARNDAATWFLNVTPDYCRRWKGAALPLDSVKKIVADPSTVELGVLGLTEQPKTELTRK